MNVKGAIFDLDGTLLDSLGIWKQIDERFLSKRNISVPDDYADSIRHMSFTETAEYTKARFDLPDSTKDIMVEWDSMAEEAYAKRVPLKPYAREFLLRLKEKGLALGVATSCKASLYIPALKRLGIFSLFSSFAETGVRGKDVPDVFLLCANTLQLRPAECVVFEDTLTALLSAKSGGFRTVAVYDPHSESATAKLKEEADLYIHSFSELLPK